MLKKDPPEDSPISVAPLTDEEIYCTIKSMSSIGIRYFHNNSRGWSRTTLKLWFYFGHKKNWEHGDPRYTRTLTTAYVVSCTQENVSSSGDVHVTT